MRFQGPLEGEDVVEDSPDLQDPPDVHLEKEDKGDEQGNRSRIKDGAAPAIEEMGKLLGKDIGKMEEEDGKKKDPGEDDLDAHQGHGLEVAVDHDQLARVPGHEGKDQQGEDPVDHSLRIVEENNQTESQVDGKG